MITDNYRGIAVGSCLSKFFLSILHNRLVTFAEKHNVIPSCQIGYKKGTPTSDHILALKNIIDKRIFSGKGKHLYACFVDYKSAFDTVWRNALFYKMLTCGIGGNFLAIIQNMYADVSYFVKLDKGLTENILSNSGVKQGCVLSPLLFNLFLHDFPGIFDDECDAVLCGTLKMNCLMFADDLVLFSESAPGLQNCLNKLNTYTKKWNLKVNINKTQVGVFKKGGKKLKHLYFYLGTEEIENVQNYYLGIIFNASGSFSNACINIADKAMKAFFKLKRINPRENALLTLKLFHSLVTPILMYGCEVWGH